MSVIAEAALSVFLELLLDKLASYALNYVADYKDVRKQLKKWQLNLRSIQAVLNDAEEKQIKDDGVKKWLADLQDLAYDVDDILDEFAYETLRLKLKKAQAQAQASTSKVRKLIPTCCTSCFSPTSFKFNNEMIPKIQKITTSLNNLVSQNIVLELREILSEGASSKGKKPGLLQPTSVMDETVEYVGRENEKKEILELLKSDNAGGAAGVSVISIVGLGGMGKTTLAQLVYNDASVFDHKAWVCVSDDFDATKITKTILTSIGPESCDGNDLNQLQVKLKEKLSGKKFLLVLDDIWNESYNDWTILRSPFGAGTKIIVTTRSRNVSSIVVTMKPFYLDKLSHDDCLSIFTQHALSARDFNGYSEFKEVGENIVRRCNGLPLAAKALGGLLRTKDLGEWERIYESDIWDIPEDQCCIVPALRLSYHHLPSHLKRCFAYCSILPKDYEFKEEEIILLWRAEGLLKQKGQNQIKDFGNQCFRDLVSRSFFQISSDHKSRFVMHDLINDLAQLVAGEICSKMGGDKQQNVSNRTRHSSYAGSWYDGVKKFESFDQVDSLRTFLPLKLPLKGVCYLTSFVLDDLLPRLKCLRVLSLNGYVITELPNFFENLKHLRHVDFSHTKIKCLPDSLCTLYHLETLILRKCSELEKLPSKIGNLMELHYLDIIGSNSIKGMPFGVGKLTNLQRLSNFILGEGEGHHIRELKNLSNLRGDFCLSGLKNVKCQDAREAKLNEKSGIDCLTLQWSTDSDDNTRKKEEERVLDFLHPQKKLEHLIIENYGGAKFSAWIADSSFKNLLSLKLSNCKNCKPLPSMGRLSKLKDLSIGGFNEVNEVGVEFFGENQPNAFALLETLSFCDMPNWKKWDPCEGDEQVLKFPSLRELSIENCPQLVGRLPTRLHSLQKLEINNCTQLVVSISSFPSLRQVTITGCQELVDRCSPEVTSLQNVSLSDISKFSIPPERMMSRFTNLEYFKIGGWKELASLSQNGLEFLGHRFITIENCPQLVSLETCALEFLTQMVIRGCPSLVYFAESNLPPTLKSLRIEDCENLKYLVDERENKSVSNISLLEDLYIEGCPSLICLSSRGDVLNGLQSLVIRGCPSLVYFAENNLPPTLESLAITDCENLKYLVDERENKSVSNISLLQDLYISISSCPSLIYLSSRGDVLNGLRSLKIDYCSKLTSLFLNVKLPMTLKKLHIFDCPELECIAQDFHETIGLESILLGSCHKIKSLPRGLDKLSHLQEITIYWCSNLVSFKESGVPPATNLRVFLIANCENFGALPNCINNFTSLRDLTVSFCSVDISFPEEGFPTNLTSLRISKAPKIYRSLVEWGLDRLTSLQRLVINGEGCSNVVLFPEEEMMLPASLTDISIGNFENMAYMLSNGFQNLTSLQELSISNCSKLKTLPEKDMLLSLGRLTIWNCPLLNEECKRGKGREWSKIAHIPRVEIHDYDDSDSE